MQATLGGGCFWCLDAGYRMLRGVSKVVSGYAGGSDPAPTYEAVCSGTTGHAEVVQVTFDEAQLSYRDVLEYFFTLHDPTTPDRQGADVGTQYRSIILAHDAAQEKEAKAFIEELEDEEVFEDPIVTKVVRLEHFYPAESYHQDYYARNTAQGYCRVVIAPKLTKLRAKWADRLVEAAHR